MSSSSSELIDLAQKGDKQAYCKLVAMNQSRLRAFIASRSRHLRDVDDIAQETFILAFDKIAQLKDISLFNSWLAGIALNKLRNHERKFNPTEDSNTDNLEALINQQIEALPLCDSSNDAMAALNLCLTELDHKAYECLSLYYFKNYSIQQLSQMTQDKHSTITMRLYRIRDALKKCVARRLGTDNE
ncbi:sigma-70 family RNA polymerase sigma factor [Paraglaciecola aquimarina]|uniref:RNA polymerase sigma factor n=1 Tax=Paraglaciecola aquimarina TaxID=1235557 RepID=A0ABU3SUV8_9ALTE|nr:sigma-70 family RNA polymerase sigma factor [Paraglaciecola aquimarina]MDU0353778.1 sigma-70 family RNA polymerase sigma factor [Paraglaciecola aquimarina]